MNSKITIVAACALALAAAAYAAVAAPIVPFERQLAQRIEERLQATAGEKGKWTVESVTIPRGVATPGEAAWEVLLPSWPSKISTVRISLTEGGAVLGWAQARLKCMGKMLAAKRAIKPGETISGADFEVRTADLLQPGLIGVSASSLMGPEALSAGLRARYTIAKGAPLVSGSVERSPVIQFGESVTLVLKGENLSISTKGVSQGNAAIGDTLSVQLRNYNRTFRGKVNESKQVEVWL